MHIGFGKCRCLTLGAERLKLPIANSILVWLFDNWKPSPLSPVYWAFITLPGYLTSTFGGTSSLGLDDATSHSSFILDRAS